MFGVSVIGFETCRSTGFVCCAFPATDRQMPSKIVEKHFENGIGIRGD
jgi:hypothetical protein